jgi:predicted metal-dependent hydrolase
MDKALFDYRLREHHRARHVRLRVSMERGLEVVVPPGFDPRRVPHLLEQKEAWIRTALARAEADRHAIDPEPAWQVPREIFFPAVAQRWQVIAQATGSTRVLVRETCAGLTVRGPIEDEQAVRAALTRWLARQAYTFLAPPLAQLSDALGFEYRRMYIKRQRSRWGSCSSRKAITLNAKLLFLSPALVRSVMIHELCHLREMNHSARFWSLVARHDPHFRLHDKSLREAWRIVPRWAS